MNGSKSKALKSKLDFALVLSRYELVFLLDMITRKNGAPMKAVKMPMGISAVVARRDTSSTSKRKHAPMSMLAGMSFR